MMNDIRNTSKILLIGDINKAFLDVDAVKKLPCQVCANISNAVQLMAKNSFTVVAIVMSGTTRLSSTLKDLRDNCDAKIILLAQMYEEPIAIQLVGSVYNNSRLADDYLICPIRFSHLVSAFSGKPPTFSVQRSTEMDERIRQLEKLATEDDLTGLKNRRYIWEFSRQIIERAKKQNGRLSLLIFDIDNFKHYNDVYGHSAGDEVLKQAAILMRRCCRSHDVVGRIGGDEFAVVFWDEPAVRPAVPPAKGQERRRLIEHPKEIMFIAQRFRKELEKAEFPLLGPEGKGVLTISGGLASLGRDGSTIQELFQQADKALLEAKRSGKNRIYLVGKPEGNFDNTE